MKIKVTGADKRIVISNMKELVDKTRLGDITIGADRQHYIVCQMNTPNAVGYVLYNLEDNLVIDNDHPDVYPLIKEDAGYQIILEQD